MEKTNHQSFIFTENISSSHEKIVEDHALLDHQLPFRSLNMERYPLQSHQVSSSASQLTAPGAVHNEKAKISIQENEGEQQQEESEDEELSAMKEMMYKIAAMQPVDIDPETIKKPTRRNIRISDDPQSVAARHRREKISEKIRILQRLVPGGTRMDTASMLEEATKYIKYLKKQIRLLEANQDQTCTAESVQNGITVGKWQFPVSSNTGAAVGPSLPVEQEFIFDTDTILNFNQEVMGDI